jgi:hypothetical protein
VLRGGDQIFAARLRKVGISRGFWGEDFFGFGCGVVAQIDQRRAARGSNPAV